MCIGDIGVYHTFTKSIRKDIGPCVSEALFSWGNCQQHNCYRAVNSVKVKPKYPQNWL